MSCYARSSFLAILPGSVPGNWGQTVAQAHRQIERLVVVHRFEDSTDAFKYTITNGDTYFSPTSC
jgi:hypothetical protein